LAVTSSSIARPGVICRTSISVGGARPGLAAIRVEKPAELDRALTTAFQSTEPILVEVFGWKESPRQVQAGTEWLHGLVWGREGAVSARHQKNKVCLTFRENDHEIVASILWFVLATCAAGAVLGQEQPRSQGTLEEVIVTAQKRAENVQNVPIAMQAYSGQMLENAGISQLTDVTRLAPNLNVVVQNSMSQHIVIRGVGTNEFLR